MNLAQLVRSAVVATTPNHDVLRFLSFLSLGASVLFFYVRRRYARDIRQSQARLDAFRRELFENEGTGLTIEYAQRWPRGMRRHGGSGSGKGDGSVSHTCLVSHGIFHGCDGGMLSVTGTFPEGDTEVRVIAPSRFGYLGSPFPPDVAGSAADQADAFAALLDHLGIQKVVVLGISAGTGAAIQMVLRHSDRVEALVISSGNWPGSPTSIAPPGWATAFYSDAAMWSLRMAVPSFMKLLMGVPSGFPRGAADQEKMDELLESIFPLAPRRRGAIHDAYKSNPEVNEYPLEDIAVPTLILHARDDPLASHDAAVEAAKRIPAARMVSLDSGGHLGLGQADKTREEIAQFLSHLS
jgi:pimeloyl-ACP methyl ester carboxylesterase